MNSLIIDGKIFYTKLISINHSLIDGKSNWCIVVQFDILQNPQYRPYFISKFESYSGSNDKFNITCPEYRIVGCFIKIVDMDFNKSILTLDISCDYISKVELSERRDNIINEIVK